MEFPNVDIALTLGVIALKLAIEKMLNVSVAIADCHGELLFFGTWGASIQTRDIAIRKAYTSARTRRNTGENAKLRDEKGQELAWFDPRYTGLQGGVAVLGDSPVASIGVSGLEPEEDEAFAKAVIDMFQEIEGLPPKNASFRYE